MTEITPELLRELIDYNSETGLMVWRSRTETHIPDAARRAGWNTKWAGKPAFINVTEGGYLRASVMHKDMKAHRVAWAIHHGRWPDQEIDHINRDKQDNRISNLRDVSPQENIDNRAPPEWRSHVPPGVDFNKGRWRVRKRVDGKRVYVGSFATLEEALRAKS